MTLILILMYRRDCRNVLWAIYDGRYMHSAAQLAFYKGYLKIK